LSIVRSLLAPNPIDDASLPLLVCQGRAALSFVLFLSAS
jgi:hypothetical protein